MERRYWGALVALLVGWLWCFVGGSAHADVVKVLRKLKMEVERLKSSQVDQDERQKRAERAQEERFRELVKVGRERAEKEERALKERILRLEGQLRVRVEQQLQALSHRMLRLEGEIRQKDAERERRIMRMEKVLREGLEKEVRGLREQNARLEGEVKSLREGLKQERAERALEGKRRLVRRYMARGKREEGHSLAKASEWYAKACSLGEAVGCAKDWEMGLKWCKSTEGDRSKWVEIDRWYALACEKGYAEGCKARGEAWFVRGKGEVGKSAGSALRWLKMACGVRYAAACRMHEGLDALKRGKAAEGRSFSEALVWYRKACGLGQQAGCQGVERLSLFAGKRRVFEVKGATFGMRWIPAGSFEMGSPSDEAQRDSSEGPQRKVTIRKGFWMLESEVTQGQYKALMGTNPSHFSSCGDNCPVEQVSWEEARAFADKLSEAQGLAGCTATDRKIFDCKGWRLPTEAEWEYAARAGTTGARHGELDRVAWYEGNSGFKTHPVGGKTANAWGLHDMLGNVFEWTMDVFGSYEGMATEDPLRITSSDTTERVMRGGSWFNLAWNVRSAYRNLYVPTDRNSRLGFRLLRR